MTYNLSKNVITKWSVHLDAIQEHGSIYFTSTRPDMLAYYLREAIAAAQFHGTEPYRHMDVTFSIRDATLLYASMNDAPKTEEATDSLQANELVSLPFNHFDVIQHANKFGGLIPVLNFAKFVGDIEPLVPWANANGYALDLNGETLTLRRK